MLLRWLTCVLTLMVCSNAYAQTTLYSVSSRDSILRTIDPATGATISSIGVVPDSGGSIAGMTGLATHPLTMKMWALLKMNGQFGRELAIINPVTGIAALKGNTGDKFAGLAFDEFGNLYGVTGDGANVPEALFFLDTADSVQAFLLTNLGHGTDGEAIGFNPDNGLLYHASGLGVANLDEIFESVSLDSPYTVTPITLSGRDYEEALALTYEGSGNFLMSALDDTLYRISSTGVVSLIGVMDHQAKGLAFQGPTGIADPPSQVPAIAVLEQNYPNPFNPVTTIEFSLPRASRITLHVFDIGGRTVRTLASGMMQAGEYHVEWDGRNAAGQRVASGIYFYQLQVDARKVATRRMILLK